MLSRISLAQVTSTPDPKDNLAIVEEYTTRAADAGARLVVFPEAMMRCFGGGALAEVAEPVDGPWADAVRSIAERAGVTVAAGMFTPADGRVRNTLLVTGGGVDAHYDKIHLYDAFGFAESDTVAPGDRPLLLEIDGTRVGFTICYDIRFPGLFQALATEGADLIVVSASWGDGPGKADQWQLLARARALDSTTFVAACGQALPTTPTDSAAPRGVGHSLAVTPDGKVLATLGTTPDLLTTDIDPSRVTEVRKTLPVLANRKY
ncbi:putative amidohydrolase [Nocardia transvalensis]|uniref:Putative amidohydrolase n=1 Tax=Nocardia transvalensis TaxID=37333 RepID=A0A7W9PK42_9NOCA|nr:carbon-nitrogen hydrolase family protein [Nocardia transvalensis]MBB5917502.1 putative amidohydrolase [Nocardia transvalensis]